MSISKDEFDIDIELIYDGNNNVIDYHIVFIITFDMFTIRIPVYITDYMRENITYYRRKYINQAQTDESNIITDHESFNCESGTNFSRELYWDKNNIIFHPYSGTEMKFCNDNESFDLCMSKWRRIEIIINVNNEIDPDILYNSLMEDDSECNILLIKHIMNYDFVEEFWVSFIGNINDVNIQDLYMGYLNVHGEISGDMVYKMAKLENFRKYMPLIYRKLYSDYEYIQEKIEEERSDIKEVIKELHKECHKDYTTKCVKKCICGNEMYRYDIEKMKEELHILKEKQLIIQNILEANKKDDY